MKSNPELFDFLWSDEETFEIADPPVIEEDLNEYTCSVDDFLINSKSKDLITESNENEQTQSTSKSTPTPTDTPTPTLL